MEDFNKYSFEFEESLENAGSYRSRKGSLREERGEGKKVGSSSGPVINTRRRF